MRVKKKFSVPSFAGSGGLMVSFGLAAGGPQARNSIPPKIRRVWGLLHVKSWRGCLERGVPAQVSSSSSDLGSKLRGPPQNSPRVDSKLDVNIAKTKPSFVYFLMC
ncbi:hypothetical protein AVEN_16975-1 [Araneus ventricosus]|uniref:Uncharacterized protein n=1 Tax=Araneus ventricosus TaxID=182803 RepID=A0A4Y2D7X5_ARAVE|nr:hypothetical protein AVEN_16975-1 [Araneus ventricosus]